MSCSRRRPLMEQALLAALFPRSYVDPNRHEHEIDTMLLSEPWPHDIRPATRADRGLGVVRRLVRATVPVYDRPLTCPKCSRASTATIGRITRS